MHARSVSIFIISAVLLYSCGSSKKAVTPVSSGNGTADSYISTYGKLAVAEMNRTGVPASITLAQGMVESGNGKSMLATEGNNHFGIKCHNNWKGPTIRHHDDRRNECFRKYSSPEESFRDHSDFLRNTPRYSSLFTLSPTDYKGWARGLRKAGYATNPDYAEMLIRKIEQYRLYEYDSGTRARKANGSEGAAVKTISETDTSVKADIPVARPSEISYIALPARISENNRIQYIIVKEGDTKKSLEEEFDLLPWELQRYNDLNQGFTLKPGQMLYLQPKRDRAEAGKEFHIVKEGETMYSISQLYGIRLKQLYMMNRIEEGDEPLTGARLWLRKTKPPDQAP